MRIMVERVHLNKRVKLLWLLPTASLLLFLLLASFAGFLIFPDTSFLGITKFNFIYALPILALIVGLLDFSWMELIYRNFTYELDANEIVIRQGVVGRRTTVIPYATIQDITVERSAAERLLGLATLEIETAGSLRLASEITLPGIAEKDTLVRELTHRAEKAKNTMGAETRTQGEDTTHILSEILQELKAIGSHLAPVEKNSKKNSEKPKTESDGKDKKESDFETYRHFKTE